jgi:hypothetical protein
MVLVFGGLSVWLNDPRLFKMKPTAVYLLLAVILGIGLLRGRFWLQYMMEDMLPLKQKGWMILTKRVTVLFLLSAAANELVWRTQSEPATTVRSTRLGRNGGFAPLQSGYALPARHQPSVIILIDAGFSP